VDGGWLLTVSEWQPSLPLWAPTALQTRAEAWAIAHPEFVGRGGGVLGCSGLTVGKHFQVPPQVSMVFKICSEHVRHGGDVVYIETHAGNMLYSKDGELMIGTGALVLEELDHLAVFAQEGFKYRAYFCERRTKAAAQARANLEGLQVGKCAQTVEVFAERCQGVIPQLARRLRLGTRGVLFIDPNGLPPADAMAWSRMSSLHNVDFVFWLDMDTGRRYRNLKTEGRLTWHVDSPNFQGDTRPLTDIFDSMQKRCWVVREPFKLRGHKRTVVIGSNWPGFPVWRKQGYWRKDEPEGQAILEQAS